MRTVIQRVSEASVTIEGEVVARTGTGLLVLLGIEDADGAESLRSLRDPEGLGESGGMEESVGMEDKKELGGEGNDDISWLTGKIVRLRVFPDEEGVMNRSVAEAGGDVLVVSQFTLHASTKKGNRPSYIRAARPEIAVPLYNRFVASLQEQLGRPVGTGRFGAMMQIRLVNDGPMTILIDSRNRE